MRLIQYLLLTTLLLLTNSCTSKAHNEGDDSCIKYALTTTSTGNNEDLSSPNAKRQTADNQPLKEWKAGSVVSEEQVATFGLKNCFAIDTISNAVFARMKGKSYKANCTLPLSQLRYLRLLHRNAEGNIQLGEMVCATDIAQDLVEIFRNLYLAHYPIERMVLVDDYDADDERSMTANNTSCFNFRLIASTGRPSKHGHGHAIDVNTLYNPYVWYRKDGTRVVSPEAGKAYADRSKSFKYKITTSDLCYKEFTKHGFKWGGSWKNRKDYQHFEK